MGHGKGHCIRKRCVHLRRTRIRRAGPAGAGPSLICSCNDADHEVIVGWETCLSQRNSANPAEPLSPAGARRTVQWPCGSLATMSTVRHAAATMKARRSPISMCVPMSASSMASLARASGVAVSQARFLRSSLRRVPSASARGGDGGVSLVDGFRHAVSWDRSLSTGEEIRATSIGRVPVDGQCQPHPRPRILRHSLHTLRRLSAF